MVAKTPIMQPMVGTSANSSLPSGFPTAMSVPGTSSTTAAGAAPSTSAPVTTADQLVPPKVEKCRAENAAKPLLLEIAINEVAARGFSHGVQFEKAIIQDAEDDLVTGDRDMAVPC
ncbi:hypothetical protein ANCDUO_03928 [Ancylostoma duodenale]|uniref:Uncharacterized protein n=1 Tax=Ancylostoma duodenale TaxID=51022 RepID=A0A0C2H8B9_9BILA|nr:hypothetical protein ANCDUO_03928 [Ancylostoma duodenale]